MSPAPRDPVLSRSPFSARLQWVVEDGTWVEAGANLFILSDEDEVKRIAEAYKMEEAKVKEVVNEAAVKRDLAVNKAIDFVKEKATIVTEKVKEEAKKSEETEG